MPVGKAFKNAAWNVCSAAYVQVLPGEFLADWAQIAGKVGLRGSRKLSGLIRNLKYFANFVELTVMARVKPNISIWKGSV